MKVRGLFQTLFFGPGEASCPNRILIRSCSEPTACLVVVETGNFLSVSAVELRFRGHPACCLVTILTDVCPLIIFIIIIIIIIIIICNIRSKTILKETR